LSARFGGDKKRAEGDESGLFALFGFVFSLAAVCGTILFGTLLPLNLNTPSALAPLCSHARITLVTRNKKKLTNSVTFTLVRDCLPQAIRRIVLCVSNPGITMHPDCLQI
jgi:hypothetical protein